MRNLVTFCLSFSLLIFGGLACKNNPLTKYSKQYTCSIMGEPDPQTADDYVKRGYKHLEENNYTGSFNDCAFGAAQEALKLDPQNTKALALRGLMYNGKQDYDAALADFNEAIRLEPDNYMFYNARSSVFEKKNMLDKAIEDRSLVISKTNSDYDYAKRGNLYFKKDDLDNALKDYTEAIRLKPDVEDYYTMRAEVYRKLGKMSDADADERQANSLEPVVVDKNDSSLPKSSTPKAKPISGGVLNGKATNLVKPEYPAAARAVRASGAVNVQVTVDEKGNVISADVVSGHPLLRAAALQAAHESKFVPTMMSGKPVQVTGVIVYNFVP